MEISRLVCNSKEFLVNRIWLLLLTLKAFSGKILQQGLELLQMEMMFAKDLNSNQLDLIHN